MGKDFWYLYLLIIIYSVNLRQREERVTVKDREKAKDRKTERQTDRER